MQWFNGAIGKSTFYHIKTQVANLQWTWHLEPVTVNIMWHHNGASYRATHNNKPPFLHSIARGERMPPSRTWRQWAECVRRCVGDRGVFAWCHLAEGEGWANGGHTGGKHNNNATAYRLVWDLNHRVWIEIRSVQHRVQPSHRCPERKKTKRWGSWLANELKVPDAIPAEENGLE